MIIKRGIGMNIRKFMILFFLLLLPAISEANSIKEIYEKAKPSVVLIITYDKYQVPLSLGSGFFFDKNHIATNYHVVEGASKIVCKGINSSSVFNVKNISSYSESLDLAILETETSGTPLVIGSEKEIEIGDKIIAIGNPRGMEGSISTGIISGIRGENGISVLQITAPISPGSSGGPLFSFNGNVVGITTATLKNSQNINFAIPANYILTLKAKGKAWEPIEKSTVAGKRSGRTGIILDQPSMYAGSLTYSIRNTTANTISNIKYLLVFIDSRTGNIIHFLQDTYKGAIAQGFAIRKEHFISSILPDWFVQGQDIYPHSPRTVKGYFIPELRVLTYDIEDNSGRGNNVLDFINQ